MVMLTVIETIMEPADCTLSELPEPWCHHCVSKARNLGRPREILGFDPDDGPEWDGHDY